MRMPRIQQDERFDYASRSFLVGEGSGQARWFVGCPAGHSLQANGGASIAMWRRGLCKHEQC
jgi:hypothetical protein